MISKKYMCVIAIVMLSGCAQTAPPASEADKQALQKAYVECVGDEAARLDDRTSPARTIATAVAYACRGEYMAVLNAHASDKNPAVRRRFIELATTQEREEDAPLAMVLEMRRRTAK